MAVGACDFDDEAIISWRARARTRHLHNEDRIVKALHVIAHAALGRLDHAAHVGRKHLLMEVDRPRGALGAGPLESSGHAATPGTTPPFELRDTGLQVLDSRLQFADLGAKHGLGLALGHLVQPYLDAHEALLATPHPRFEDAEALFEPGQTPLDLRETPFDVGETPFDVGEAHLDLGEPVLEPLQATLEGDVLCAQVLPLLQHCVVETLHLVAEAAFGPGYGIADDALYVRDDHLPVELGQDGEGDGLLRHG